MSDDNNEKKGSPDDAVAVPMEDLDDSKAHLMKSNANGGAGDVSVGIIDPTSGSSDGDVSFSGLGKDEVLQYANAPFWVRLRWILFILFWVGWTAMLVAAIVIIVVAPRCPHRPDMKWYEKEAVYQVYAKSFKDTAKDDKTAMDGYGDFQGLKDKMDYITDLGLKAVYLNSIFKTEELTNTPDLSDMAIIDHKMLDDRFGTDVDAFTSWVKNMRKEGKQVVVDLIPNQTSKKHMWYQKAVKGEADYKKYYIWAQSAGAETNVNGDSAWTKEDANGEFYFSSLSSELPDLNLAHEAVREEIAEIMKFWLDAGVGGFRINGLDYLVEDDQASGANETAGGTLKYLEELRTVVDGYSDKPGRERFIFGTVSAEGNDISAYYKSDDEKAKMRLHMVIPKFDLKPGCNASCLINLIKPLSEDSLPWVGLQFGNENTERIGAKLKGSTNGVMISHALQMLLPGTPFNYYGDEFGLMGSTSKGEPMDSRTPMQWSSRKNAGFSDVTPWLELGDNYQADNVEMSEAHFRDMTDLKAFKDLLQLRTEESFQFGTLKACAVNDDVLLFTRKAEGFPFFLTMINAGSKAQGINLEHTKCVESKEKGTVRFHSNDKDVGETLDFENAPYLEAGEIVVIEFAK